MDAPAPPERRGPLTHVAAAVPVFLEWEMRRLGEGEETQALRARIDQLSGPRSLLHHAAETAMPEALQVLLDESMCSLEARDEDGCTPLVRSGAGPAVGASALDPNASSRVRRTRLWPRAGGRGRRLPHACSAESGR